MIVLYYIEISRGEIFMNQFIQKKELFIKNPSYLLKVKKRFDMLKDKEDKTVAEEKTQDMPETEEDVAKKINS